MVTKLLFSGKDNGQNSDVISILTLIDWTSKDYEKLFSNFSRKLLELPTYFRNTNPIRKGLLLHKQSVPLGEY